MNGLKLDAGMAEFCGIVQGDGNIWTNNRKYEITITGSPKDSAYMDYVARYAAKNIKPGLYYRVRGRGLRLTIYSKRLFLFLTKGLGMGSGALKSGGGVPLRISKSKKLLVSYIRGLFDTDGSVFTSDKDGAPGYPAIEITNENIQLLLYVRDSLDGMGFRTTLRKSNSETYKIAIHGKRMIRLWIATIGSSHPRKLSKMESIIKTLG